MLFELTMSPIVKCLLHNPCKTLHRLAWLLAGPWFRLSSDITSPSTHILGRMEVWRISHCWRIQLQAEKSLSQLLFLAVFSCPCLFVSLQGWANIYSLCVHLVVLLSQMSPGFASNAQFVYAEAVFQLEWVTLRVVTDFLFFNWTCGWMGLFGRDITLIIIINTQPQFKFFFFFTINSRSPVSLRVQHQF